MFLNGLCRQPELQISESDTSYPEILSFLHLNANEGRGRRGEPRWKKCNLCCCMGRVVVLAEQVLSFELKNGLLLFLSSLSGILQQNLQWQNIDSERAEIIKENH